MSRIAVGFCLMLLAAGCNKNNNTQQALFHEDGRVKPIVALVPVIDKSDSDLPWDLSEEMTLTIKERLLHKENLYLADPRKVVDAAKSLSSETNPFGGDLSSLKVAFPKQEFVVFMELIEHREVPVTLEGESLSENSPAELKMSIRLRVIDLRGHEPKIVLQELIHDSQYIPRQFTSLNFFQVPWGKESYNITPLGLAHAKVAKEIASRVEDYILIAKSK